MTITSNNNQSNSFVLRQHQLWARAAFHNGWSITGGQMWSLATETTHHLSNSVPEILPSVMDPQYVAGFVWRRQYGFRVTKGFRDKIRIGAAAEVPRHSILPGQSLPINLLLGSNGNSSSSCSNPTANYLIKPGTGHTITKIAFDPGFGHYQLFGITTSSTIVLLSQHRSKNR